MNLSEIFTSLVASPTLLALALSLVLSSLYTCAYFLFSRQTPENVPVTVRDNYPLTGPVGFWTERWHWFKRQRDQSPHGNFSFNVGPHKVIAVSGDVGRKLFFESHEMGLTEGYAAMFGAIPELELGKKSDPENHFNRRLTYLLKTDMLRRRLPTLISDIHDAFDGLKTEAPTVTDPFESIYRLVYRLTIRMVGADEIAEDPKIMEESLKWYEFIEHSTTAFAVMYPKIPSPAILKRWYGGARLISMIKNIVKRRAASDEKHDDALQHMIDQGDDTFRIVEFIVGSLSAGILNSGINAAWVLCYLATSPEWLTKAREEVRSTAAKYAKDPSASLRFQLDQCPLEAFEQEFPIIDLCLRDSIRLNLLGTAFRKNISGRPIPIGNGKQVVPVGAIATYALADIHHDPEVYSDPDTWDPARYLLDRAEDKIRPYGFLGWGVARHPCRGMRFAKLEQNMIAAYFLAAFDFHLEDKHENILSTPPKVDQNGHSAGKPRDPLFLRISAREE